jgi:signal transduction histidine kinase
MRSSWSWLLFFLFLSVFAGALGWMSLRMLGMEKERLQNAEQAQVQEKMRLALWRMDSIASALLIRESARPAQHYQAFYVPEDAFTLSNSSLPKGAALIPSPLFGKTADFVNLHFEESAQQTCTSPQVPSGSQFSIANQWYANGQDIEQAKGKLTQLEGLLRSHPALRLAVPPITASLEPQKKSQLVSVEPIKVAAVAKEEAVKITSKLEQKQRAVIIDQNLKSSVTSNNIMAERKVAPSKSQKKLDAAGMAKGKLAEATKPKELPAEVTPPFTTTIQEESRSSLPTVASDFKAIWAEMELLLLRRASMDGVHRLQGVWVDWPKLRESMLEAVKDILPAAQLKPELASSKEPAADVLVTLPVRLIAGKVPMDLATENSPLRRALAFAWAGLLVAALAIAFVLHRTMQLGERRAAFVSAVTHELRTPLTTFRLYSEMLADEMVPDAKQRKSYLNTLCEESTRLMHLVENVLSYSRIERGRTAARLEQVKIGDLVQRMASRIEQRASSNQMQLVLDLDPEAVSHQVKVDPLGVEQILFNLTDNACKYAAPDCERRELLLEVGSEGKWVTLSLRDYGPGLSKTAQQKLFQPFAKSATEAAHTAPGVGLGLALCHRLATEQGGRLYHKVSQGRGCCFVLELPIHPAHA